MSKHKPPVTGGFLFLSVISTQRLNPPKTPLTGQTLLAGYERAAAGRHAWPAGRAAAHPDSGSRPPTP